MKILVLTLGLILGFSQLVMADEDNDAAVRECLKHWGKHPFASASPKYRVLATKVKVLGIGGNTKAEQPTEKPELVLVKSSVSVMAKTKLELMNPNGWYCLEGRVSVLGKTQIDIHCKAKLASSSDGVEVLGANSGGDSGGVSVLGSTRVNRQDCGT